MIRNYLKKHLENDAGISPVIGTILMIVATVIIGGAVYAAISQYNGKSAKPPTDAAFKAQSTDTNGDGVDDTIKVTYLTGPASMTSSTVRVNLTSAATGASHGGGLEPGTASHATAGQWNPGDFETYTLWDATQLGATFVTVSLGSNTILDQSISLAQVV